jgi:uncharacterized membrane protein YeiB
MLLDVPKSLTQMAQLGWSLGVVAVVVRVWRSGATAPVRNAAAVVGTFAASPYVFVYDLVAVAAAYGWFLGLHKGAALARLDICLLVTCALLPVAGWGLAAVTGVQVGPLVLAVLLARVVMTRTSDVRRKAV